MFAFINFLHTNSYKLVKFCGQSLNKFTYNSCFVCMAFAQFDANYRSNEHQTGNDEVNDSKLNNDIKTSLFILSQTLFFPNVIVTQFKTFKIFSHVALILSNSCRLWVKSNFFVRLFHPPQFITTPQFMNFPKFSYPSQVLSPLYYYDRESMGFGFVSTYQTQKIPKFP